MAKSKCGSQSVAVDSPGYAEDLAGRSLVYAVLARGFGHPDQQAMDFYASCGQVEHTEGNEISKCLAKVLESALSAEMEQLQQAYINWFDPVHGPFAYETENLKGHEFAKAQIMADIMGFYKAFGVEPRTDRADHISAELEFMHFLTFKENYALDKGQADKAEICLEARKKFFAEHLSTWVGSLLDSIKASKGEKLPEFYASLVRLLELFIRSEKELLR